MISFSTFYFHFYVFEINHHFYSSLVVSAAIVRVFGDEVAELPLVATRSDCQGKVGLLLESNRKFVSCHPFAFSIEINLQISTLAGILSGTLCLY